MAPFAAIAIWAAAAALAACSGKTAALPLLMDAADAGGDAPDVAVGTPVADVAPPDADSLQDAAAAVDAGDVGPAADAASPDASDAALDVTLTGCPPDAPPPWAGAAVNSPANPSARPPGVACAAAGWPSDPSPTALAWTDVTASLGLANAGVIDSCVLLQDLTGDGVADILTVAEPTSPIAPPELRLAVATAPGQYATKAQPLAALGRVVDCAAGDFSGDNAADLVLVTQNGVRILVNQGGTFVDVTATWLPSSVTATSFGALALFDADRDGRLDVLLAAKQPLPQSADGGACLLADQGYLMCCVAILPNCATQFAGTEQVYTCCDNQLAPSAKYLLHNTGISFTDVTAASGITATGNTQTLTAFDIDRDGWLDVFWGDDLGPHGWYRNLGNSHFAAHTADLGMRPYAHAMGSALGDVDGDHRADLLLSSWGPSILYAGQVDGFADISDGSGLAWLTENAVPWAYAFADFDADGWLDVVNTQSYVAAKGKLIGVGQAIPSDVSIGYHAIGHNSGGAFQKQVLLWPGDAYASFTELALATGDLDGDGDLDLLTQSPPGRLTIWRNDSKGQHWLRVRLNGKTAASVVGAVVQVWKAGAVQERRQQLAGGFGAHDDGVLTFGLGNVATVDQVRVWWPSGMVTELGPVAGGQVVVVAEP